MTNTSIEEKIEELRYPRNQLNATLEDAIQAMYQLKLTSKRLEKIKIIKDHATNDIFKQFFWWSQNPYLRYNIKNINGLADVTNYKINSHSFTYFTGILRGLNNRKWTGNAAQGIVRDFFNPLSPEERDIYGKILRRNLQVGVTTKTFNTIFPNYIPSFNVMLAKEEKKVKKKPKEVVLEIKYDGYRSITRVEKHRARMYSRNGKPYTGFNDLIKELNKLPDGVYDGEIIDPKNKFSYMQRQAMKKETKKHGILNLFDYVTLDEFDHQFCDMKLLDRKKRLQNRMSNYPFKYIKYVINSEVLQYGDPKIEKYYHKYLNMGYEGAVMKDIEGVYTFKRSPYWLKIVPFISVDLKIIDFKSGQPNTKYEHTLGSFVCDYYGFPLDVSGIPDELRDEIWNNQKEYLGSVIEVHAREESTNKNNERSLRFPRFIRFRPDK